MSRFVSLFLFSLTLFTQILFATSLSLSLSFVLEKYATKGAFSWLCIFLFLPFVKLELNIISKLFLCILIIDSQRALSLTPQAPYKGTSAKVTPRWKTDSAVDSATRAFEESTLLPFISFRHFPSSDPSISWGFLFDSSCISKRVGQVAHRTWCEFSWGIATTPLSSLLLHCLLFVCLCDLHRFLFPFLKLYTSIWNFY